MLPDKSNDNLNISESGSEVIEPLQKYETGEISKLMELAANYNLVSNMNELILLNKDPKTADDILKQSESIFNLYKNILQLKKYSIIANSFTEDILNKASSNYNAALLETNSDLDPVDYHMDLLVNELGEDKVQTNREKTRANLAEFFGEEHVRSLQATKVPEENKKGTN